MIEIHSPTWATVKAILDDLQADAMRVCLAPGVDERKADFQRGVAYAVQRLLESAAGEVAPKANLIPFE